MQKLSAKKAKLKWLKIKLGYDQIIENCLYKYFANNWLE